MNRLVSRISASSCAVWRMLLEPCYICLNPVLRATWSELRMAGSLHFSDSPNTSSTGRWRPASASLIPSRRASKLSFRHRHQTPQSEDKSMLLSANHRQFK